MVCVCAWCERYLGIKEPLDSLEVTHGICSVCKSRQQLGELPTLVVSRRHADARPILESLLRGTEIPIVVDRRVYDRRHERPTVDIPGGRRMLRDRRSGTHLVVD